MNNKSIFVNNYFDKEFKNAKCSLDFFNDYSLLIAIMLSAQCTDKKVNLVTKKLFNKYKTLDDLNKASLSNIQEILKPLGLYKNKSIYLKNIVKDLIEEFDYKVPNNKKDLLRLDGVGNKTANVFLAEFYNEDQFPVDTHINRVSKRLNYANDNDSVIVVENNLKKNFDKSLWIKLHHQFINFGRNICLARNPKCNKCGLKKYCVYFKKLSIQDK